MMRVKGKILDEQRHPIFGATVDILVNRVRLARVTSADDGEIEFSTIELTTEQPVTLAVAKEGYRSSEVTKALEHGSLEGWQVVLQRLPPISRPAPPPIPQKESTKFTRKPSRFRRVALIAIGILLVFLLGRACN